MRHGPIVPFGEPRATALLKSRPEDFEVDEVLGFEPHGQGEHLFIQVQKRGLTTRQLIDRIARDHGLPASAFGYSGLKDKHALTRQWLSLQLPGKDAPFDHPEGEGYRVLRQARHNKKLRPGSHRFNDFRLCLREVGPLAPQTLARIDAVRAHGFANYFGRQRFGSKADNVEQALSQLGRRRMARARKSILLSALRSDLFNRILASRIEQGYWLLPLDGDVFMLRGSHSIFSEALNAALLQRYREFDLSSCGSLYGDGHNPMSGLPLAIERRVFEQNTAITECLKQHRSRLQMRPLRAIAESLSYHYDDSARSLRLQVRLPAGSYVTSLLEHFFRLEEGMDA